MKRITAILIALAGSLLLLVWAFAQPAANGPADLSRLVPSGPLLFLEAKDFGTLLRDWNGSTEKRAWLTSDNFQVFSRSRLYLKLEQAQKEFAAAAGVPPNMDLLGNVAGAQSALAIYDIGALEFLYITRLPADRFAAGALWKVRGNYQPRRAANIDYYIKTDTATRRTSAFAVARDYVLLATREDVLAGALSLIGGQAQSSIAAEPWFAKASAEAKTPGELRMAMNFEKLVRSPHFRSYWIQQNITEMKQYSAAIADAGRVAGELRENRVLIRGNDLTPAWNEAAVGEILRFAPATGVYRAWASPSSADAFELIRRKLIAPGPVGGITPKTAPTVSLGDGITGDEADLETRIDEPPLDTGSEPLGAELRKLLDSTKLEAMLSVGATRVQADGVFVGSDSAVTLLASTDWDSAALRNALTSTLAKSFSNTQLGVQWTERRAGNAVYYELDGLVPMFLGANGKLLTIATRRELLPGTARPAGASARYAAGYSHSSELPNFVKMMRLIDAPLTRDAAPQEPAFFSGNIASLGQTLSRVDSESILVHDTGSVVTQNLVYRFK